MCMGNTESELIMKKRVLIIIALVILVISSIASVYLTTMGTKSVEDVTEDSTEEQMSTEPTDIEIPGVVAETESVEETYSEPFYDDTPVGYDLTEFCSESCKLTLLADIPAEMMSAYNSVLYPTYTTDTLEFVSYEAGVLVLKGGNYVHTFDYNNGEPYSSMIWVEE